MHISIRRSSRNRVVAGVLGGLAVHFDWNANLLRIIWVLLTLTPFPGLIIYLILWLIMK
ncbi:PspC domain-containing protein [Bombilactobacillus folatiphilus]|uniref:PspC domain-containing protein n=1 Tax=Bombilactobacillus folatiphilus TaxID=2923362 RepID=A0ABY4P7P9_9LACO|nr:PspC domain-containing protein [Bombilactobacillus folatiphilus]UQS81549.1 PspC domain-containing protein [Bombilactobacillus folatiphilus]